MFRRWTPTVLVRILQNQPRPAPNLSKRSVPLNQPHGVRQILLPTLRYWSSSPSYTLSSASPASRPICWSLPLILPAGLLSFLVPKDPNAEDETPEGQLIMCIKRSILCIQREQYAKAEQMLHVALRMAQDLQNKEGITFIFDVMANLAMETEQYKKAERLFVTVMQRLLADGCAQDDIKV